jgi:nucleotide-binding universal stress UspA family protein
MRTQQWIVVGIDASETSKRALRWALAEASRTGARVDAVHAYDVPVYPGPSIGQVQVMVHDAAVTLLRNIVTGPAADYPDVVVRQLIRRGPPGPALVHAAAGARLLVVGTSVRSRLRGLVLGSTAEYCAAHAGCPVVVLRCDVAVTGSTPPAPRAGATPEHDAG